MSFNLLNSSVMIKISNELYLCCYVQIGKFDIESLKKQLYLNQVKSNLDNFEKYTAFKFFT